MRRYIKGESDYDPDDAALNKKKRETAEQWNASLAVGQVMNNQRGDQAMLLLAQALRLRDDDMQLLKHGRIREVMLNAGRQLSQEQPDLLGQSTQAFISAKKPKAHNNTYKAWPSGARRTSHRGKQESVRTLGPYKHTLQGLSAVKVSPLCHIADATQSRSGSCTYCKHASYGYSLVYNVKNPTCV